MSIFGNLGNFAGFLSLLFYIFTLIPTIVRVVLPRFRKNSFVLSLTKKRREVGIMAWIFGMIHGTYILFERNLNLLDPSVAIKYFQGLTLITIFTLLAVTSNDYSLKKLKKNWKNLHRLTYLALVFIPWHVLDKMWGNFTIWTYLGLVMMLFTIYFMFSRYYIQVLNKKENTQHKSPEHLHKTKN